MLRVHKRVVRNAGPHVGILAQRLARGDIQALEPAALRRCDRRFQEHFGPQKRVPGTGLNTRGIAAQINLLANLDGLDLESRAGCFQDLERGIHDLRAYAVSMGDGDRCFGGHNRKQIGYWNAQHSASRRAWSFPPPAGFRTLRLQMKVDADCGEGLDGLAVQPHLEDAVALRLGQVDRVGEPG